MTLSVLSVGSCVITGSCVHFRRAAGGWTVSAVTTQPGTATATWCSVLASRRGGCAEKQPEEMRRSMVRQRRLFRVEPCEPHLPSPLAFRAL